MSRPGCKRQPQGRRAAVFAARRDGALAGNRSAPIAGAWGRRPWYVPATLGLSRLAAQIEGNGFAVSLRKGFALSLGKRSGLGMIALAGLTLSACGGQQQDVHEPSGKFPVTVVSASFPSQQQLAEKTVMHIVVRNAGSRQIPNISVTVKCGAGTGGSFTTNTSQQDAADSQRPTFIVDNIPTAGPRHAHPLDPTPLERSTALVDTYPVGPLAPGATRSFRWDVVGVKAGPFKICWRVNAGLYGKAIATAASGSGPINGTFTGAISREPSHSLVGPDNRVISGAAPGQNGSAGAPDKNAGPTTH
ncbi:MAG: hypothetical protein NVSMB25_20600 [Thermoleophilaceae bacterium]